MATTSDLDKLNRFRWRLEALLAKGPAYLYTYGRWRFLGWWRGIKDALFSPSLDDAALLNAIDLGEQELSEVRKAVAERNLEDAKRALVVHFKTRTRPKFHFGPADKPAILSAIESDWRKATIRAADETCQNIFRFRHLGPVKFEAGVEWTFGPQGNVDWTWDLNRHPYFNTLGKAYWYTGDEKYAEKFVELLLDWINKNPAGVNKPNWESVLEIAARLNNWIWAYHFFLHAEAFNQEAYIAFLRGLLTLARHLAARLEYHATNNHLFLEAKALAFCGLLFPEFKEAKKWRETGLRILWEQVEKQVCPDGVHAERSILYHRAVTSELLEMAVLLDNNGLPIPERVINRLEKMIEFDLNITKPDGTIPLLGDSALTDNYVRFSGRCGRGVLFDRLSLAGNGLGEEMVWLLGGRGSSSSVTREEATVKLTSKPFAEGGYFVMRGGEGERTLYLVFDCGPFGYEPVPGHGHADALSFDLYAYGRTLITDCGAYSYYLGEDWRNYFRGTSAHNTIVVDGQDQSILMGYWHVHRMAQATLHEWVSNEYFDFVDGSHDGYHRLTKPVTHRRSILFVKPEYWIVIDLLAGQGVHTLEQYFHLMPWATPHLNQKTRVVRVDDHGFPAMTIAPTGGQSLRAKIVTGATDPIQGWVSFYSGEKIAAPVLKYKKTVQLPAIFCTVLYPHPPGSSETLRVADIQVIVESKVADRTMIGGLAVETANYVDTCVIALDDTLSWKTFAGYESDAELVYLRHRKSDGALVKVAIKPRTATLKIKSKNDFPKKPEAFQEQRQP